MRIADEVRTWLASASDDAPFDDTSSRAQDETGERLLGLTRALRPRRTMVAGVVVVHHPAGPPFAAAVDGRIVVRYTTSPGTLVSEPVDGLPGWIAVDPFPPDVAFARGEDTLRHLLTRACEDAAPAF